MAEELPGVLATGAGITGAGVALIARVIPRVGPVWLVPE